MKNLDLKDLEICVTTQDFQKQVEGYGLTTANILYRRPDHPWLLQSYVWQNYDLYPDFHGVRSFLGFWQKSLEGVLHSVTVAHSRTRRDQNSGWHFQASLISDWIDRRPLSLTRT